MKTTNFTRTGKGREYPVRFDDLAGWRWVHLVRTDGTRSRIWFDSDAEYMRFLSWLYGRLPALRLEALLGAEKTMKLGELLRELAEAAAQEEDERWEADA